MAVLKQDCQIATFIDTIINSKLESKFTGFSLCGYCAYDLLSQCLTVYKIGEVNGSYQPEKIWTESSCNVRCSLSCQHNTTTCLILYENEQC